MRGARTVVALALGGAVTLAACSSAPESAPKVPAKPVTIAFAGDVHFAGNLAGRLDNPSTAMGPMATTLASADLAVLNLETAVTTTGSAQPKQFAFRAPPAVFDALKGAGIDVVTMANNHLLTGSAATTANTRWEALARLHGADHTADDRTAGRLITTSRVV